MKEKCAGRSLSIPKAPPVHPGEILNENFLKPLGISQYRVAVAIGVPPRRINEIVLGKRRITANTALRLGRFFNMEAQFWLSLQTHFDLEIEVDRSGNSSQTTKKPL
jgi:addiction module HigA family antidote